jgi:hypothetical protein
MATSRWANDGVMDAALDKIATCTALRVCSGASNPVDRAAAVAATLATVTLDSGDFSKANGDVSGRKVTIAQQANMSITASGDATCVTLDDGSTLQYVVPSTSQPLTSGGTVTSPAFDVEFGDPVAP